MMNTLHTHRVRVVLNRLFSSAALDEDAPPPPLKPGLTFETATAQEHGDALEDVYGPISEQGGALLYSLVRAIRPATIVELGTSFGISTVYLAAAVADNAVGRVVSTELSARKISAARANLVEAGLDGVVTILEGDA